MGSHATRRDTGRGDPAPVTRYLVDSTVLIGFARGDIWAREWFQATLNSSEEVGVSVVNVAECLSHAHPAERPGWAEFFAVLTVWPVTAEDAVAAGAFRYDSARAGTQTQLSHALIAAAARRVGATVVTGNTKDFRMAGLAVEQLPRP